MLVHEKLPEIFAPSLDVCGVIVECENKVLLLKRHPEKSHGSHWNLPAGKLEKFETPLQAAKRELFEESGILVSDELLLPLGTLYFTPKEIHFNFHLFYSKVEKMPQVLLADAESVDARWWHWNDVIYPIIPGGQEVLKFCRKKIKDLKKL